MAVAVEAIETKSSFGHTRFIDACAGAPSFNREGTRLMALISSAIPEGDLSMTNALVGADCMAALPSRAYPRTSGQPGFHGTSLETGREEGMGTPRNEQPCGAPLSGTPNPPSRRGLFLVPCRLRPPDQKGPTSTVRRRCTVPLGALGEMCFGPLVGVSAGNIPGPLAPSHRASRHDGPRQGTVSTSVCLNSSAVARMGTL